MTGQIAYYHEILRDFFVAAHRSASAHRCAALVPVGDLAFLFLNSLKKKIQVDKAELGIGGLSDHRNS